MESCVGTRTYLPTSVAHGLVCGWWSRGLLAVCLLGLDVWHELQLAVGLYLGLLLPLGTGTCEPKKADGQTCGNTYECQSDHCQNGFCCASGNYKRTTANCTAFTVAPSCTSAVAATVSVRTRRVTVTSSASRRW